MIYNKQRSDTYVEAISCLKLFPEKYIGWSADEENLKINMYVVCDGLFGKNRDQVLITESNSDILIKSIDDVLYVKGDVEQGAILFCARVKKKRPHITTKNLKVNDLFYSSSLSFDKYDELISGHLYCEGAQNNSYDLFSSDNSFQEIKLKKKNWINKLWSYILNVFGKIKSKCIS